MMIPVMYGLTIRAMQERVIPMAYTVPEYLGARSE